jgi:hypothetical protein
LLHGKAASAFYRPGALAPIPIQKEEPVMQIHLALTPVVSLIAGVLILAMPRLLNFIVALYLIIIGLIGIFGTGGMHL